MELLHELVPKATVIALLVNPDNPFVESNVRQAQGDARSFGQQLHVLRARTNKTLTRPLQLSCTCGPARSSSDTDPFFDNRREQLVGAGGTLRRACGL